MAIELADRKCVPCRGGTPPLTPEQYAPLLAQLDAWNVEEGTKLVKSFRFKNFVQAVEFVNAITGVAEAEGHHPDLYVRWGETRVYLWTHKINGLSESDFVMAAKIDRLYAQHRQAPAGAPASPGTSASR
jgi:4a-hydroxytetrahydrobiopterin dehydratase